MSKSKLIPLARLREPEHPARTEVKDDGLESMAKSIRALGILEPLIVHPVEGEEFEVVAGHRRLLAARLVGLASVPCLIEEDAKRADAIKIHENVEREELSTADEAVFYQELFQKLGKDTDAVAARVRKSREYVERRLLLLRGYEDVFMALRQGKISLGVAEELNKMTREADAKYYLEYGVKSGISIRLAREWRGQANVRAELEGTLPPSVGASPPEGSNGPPTPPPGPSFLGIAKPYELSSSKTARQCRLCGETHEEWQMWVWYICQPCGNRYTEEVIHGGR